MADDENTTTTPGMCACGCGEPVALGARYVRGHNVRGPAVPQENIPEGHVATAIPGVWVKEDEYVVLSSRLGRMMEPLPKIDPNDPNEAIKYHVPEAWERGDIVHSSELYNGVAAGYKNGIDRLLRIGAIARMDHPEANGAVSELRYRREQESRIMAERGVL